MQSRWAGLLFVWFCPFLMKAAGDDALGAAQRLFDAMKTHDSAAAGKLFLSGAVLASVDAAGKPSLMPAEKFVERMGSAKGEWLERIWKPTVLEHGSIAVVWANYDFHLNGKFSHCGVDSFNLVKTESGWKIAAVSDTRETAACPPSPLGPIAPGK